MMSFAAGALARWIAPFLTLAVVAGLVLSTAPVHTGPIRLADDAAPVGGSPFYVDPNSAAMRASKANPDSPELAYIANTPRPTSSTTWSRPPR
ncbi:hypothetical protein [Mycobacterium sp. ELW1]|uniref:hypothetical protein n=1 Tax=Mycobacterium sp. ELW1 TaxID=1547487 RepID=UPI001AEFB584|nr:hypothetical protein [Mycobacterium sp. ELW1]